MTGRAAAGYRAMHRASLVDGATPHALTAMLFDGAISRIKVARHPGSDPTSHAAVRRRAIDGALAIVHELQGALRDTDTDPISTRLYPLYNWIASRLVAANTQRDDAALDEALALIEPLRDAWWEIGPQAGQNGSHG